MNVANIDVIVSAADVPFFGPETYIFPARKGVGNSWEAANLVELRGSFRGGLDHKAALKRAGYELEMSN